MTYLEREFYNRILKFVNKLFAQRPNQIFWVLVGLIAIIMISIHQDYGLTNDEPIHQAHGEVVLNYFENNDSMALQSPLDSAGNLVETFSTEKDEKFRGMNFFGGYFDLTVNYLHKLSPNTNIYQFRHLINSLFGLLIFIFIGLIVKELVGWQAAILGLIFAVLSPRLFGHAFANPKDIPFGTLYTISIYAIIHFYKNLPKIKIGNAISLIFIIGISISIRVSGLLIIGYLGLAFLIFWIANYFETKNLNLKQLIISGLTLSIIIIIGYLSTTLFWPYAKVDLWAPIKILSKVSNFAVFNAYELFKGQWYNRWEIPWSYIPTWIWISVPVFINLGIIFIGIIYHRKLRGEINLFIYSFLLFSFLFPGIFIIIKGSNIYNGIRHLLFIFPPLIALSAVAWWQIVKHTKKTYFYYSIVAILILSTLQPLIWSIKAHPYQAMYFSPLAGGNAAIFGKYETDYWGISTKEAVEWIARKTEEERESKTIKIKMFYGDRQKVTNYSLGYKNLEYFVGNGEKGWDYEIIYLSAAKFDKNLLYQWPPKNTVHQITANGLPLAAIVINKFAGLTTEEMANKYPSETNYITLSLEFYAKADFVNAYLWSQKAYQVNNNNTLAMNNMGAAANAMELYEIAYDILENCVKIDSEFQLAKNNLKIAKEGKETKADSEKLLRLSVRAYFIGKYEYSAKYAKEILKTEPNNSVAWNNLGSALNALERFEEAKTACEKAIKLDPNFQLAKNNLNYAISKLK